MYKAGKTAQIATEMRNYKLAVLGISETRWTQSGRLRLGTGETLIYSGHEEDGARHTEGVGLMLSKEAAGSLMEWTAVSSRILHARFRTKIGKLLLIQCYAPTNEADDETKSNFYQRLQAIIDQRKRKDVLILMGDFNAKIGADNTNRDQAMGKEGLGKMNENGELFADLCCHNSLVIGGSMFSHKRIHKATWVSPDHRTENQIDHICIGSKFRRSLFDVRVNRGADVGSDHHLVTAKIRLKLKKHLTRATKPGMRYNTELLQDGTTKDAFGIELSNKYEALASLIDEDSTTEQSWQRTREALKETCSKILGRKTTQHKDWISSETIRKVEERKKMKAKLNESRTRAAKAEAARLHAEANKEVKRSTRQDKRNFVDALAEKAEQAAQQKNMKELYDTTRKLSGKRRTTDHPVKDTTGEVLTKQEDQLRRWMEYFKDLLNRPPPTDPPDIQPAEETLPITTTRPTKAEIKKALKMLNNGKAPGPDGIPPEALKADISVTTDILYEMFGRVWESEEIPADWKHGYIIKMPKKGDMKECKNWRGITLLSIPGKVFNRVILERMKDKVDKHLRDEQAGFRKERSCTDQIATLRTIIEQSLEWNSSLYITFVDFEKAFDSIDRNTLWKLLGHHGIPGKIINLIRNTYEPSTCQVVHNGTLTEPFDIQTGVRQGCLLSPFLFLLVIDWVMTETTRGYSRGIQWNILRHLEDIDFADDITLLSHRHQDMQSKTTSLDKTGGRAGMKVNIPKTKNMRINHSNDNPIVLRGEQLEEVDKFPHLGSIVSKDGGTDQDIGTRIGKATTAFKLLAPVWRSRTISIKTKLKLFNSNVKSVLLYACETWRTTKAGIHRLQTFVNRCLRSILHIRWEDKISNTVLWNRTSQERIEIQVLRRKWNWIGHTLRKPSSNITRHALRWSPPGKRRPGRPRITWRRSTESESKEAKMTWSQIEQTAQDRRKWRQTVAGLCSSMEQRA